MNPGPFYKTPGGGAFLSALIPSLGLFVRGYPKHAISTLTVGGMLFGVVWGITYWGGIGSGVFAAILIVLPWWVFQSFQAALPTPLGLKATWRIIWIHGHDIRYLGALFLFAAFSDLSIILANPAYSLNVFCTRPTGLLGVLAKAQSPTFHLTIGYGFLRQRQWSLLLYLVYAGYGLLNATVNYVCEGYGRIRTAFFVTLLVFTIFVIIRRNCFYPHKLLKTS